MPHGAILNLGALANTSRTIAARGTEPSRYERFAASALPRPGHAPSSGLPRPPVRFQRAEGPAPARPPPRPSIPPAHFASGVVPLSEDPEPTEGKFAAFGRRRLAGLAVDVGLPSLESPRFRGHLAIVWKRCPDGGKT